MQDGVDGQPAQTGNGEDVLDDHRAADQRGGCDAMTVTTGTAAFLSAWPEQDLHRAYALRAGGAHVILGRGPQSSSLG